MPTNLDDEPPRITPANFTEFGYSFYSYYVIMNIYFDRTESWIYVSRLDSHPKSLDREMECTLRLDDGLWKRLLSVLDGSGAFDYAPGKYGKALGLDESTWRMTAAAGGLHYEWDGYMNAPEEFVRLFDDLEGFCTDQYYSCEHDFSRLRRMSVHSSLGNEREFEINRYGFYYGDSDGRVAYTPLEGDFEEVSAILSRYPLSSRAQDPKVAGGDLSICVDTHPAGPLRLKYDTLKNKWAEKLLAELFTLVERMASDPRRRRYPDWRCIWHHAER